MNKIRKSEFRVLLVYPNLAGMLVPSLAIALFTSILRGLGCQVDLFDTTNYLTEENSSPEKRVKYLQARKFSYEEDLGVKRKVDAVGDFRKMVDTFQPHLMLVSVVEDAFRQALALLGAVQDRGIPTVVGGVFVTAAPEVVISYSQIQMIGVGEGESMIPEIVGKMRNGLSLEDVPGLWIKQKGGAIIRNPRGPLVDLNGSLPDFSLFEESRFYRPMGGRIFKTVPIETYRGCPYFCAYCNTPMQKRLAKADLGANYLRRKSISRVREEILSLIHRHNPEFFYFIDDSFLARPEKEFLEFIEMYKEFRIPFWFNTRPENCTGDRLRLLREVNCFRISVGLEHGSEEFRQTVLNRMPTNELLLKHFDIMAKGGIDYSINNMVGFPDETRELVFETIMFSRQISGYDTLTVSIFTPYHGTELRDYAVMKRYLDPKTLTTHTTASSLLKMPLLTSKQIDGLVRTFPLYVKFPQSIWPRIREAEQFTEHGEAVFAELSDTYHHVYLSQDQFGNAEEPDWEEVFGHMSKTQLR